MKLLIKQREFSWSDTYDVYGSGLVALGRYICH